MNKLLTLLLCISLLLSGEIRAFLFFLEGEDSRLLYDLKAYEECVAQGIPCTQSEPYIRLEDRSSQRKLGKFPRLPLRLLLHPNGDIKTDIVYTDLNGRSAQFSIMPDVATNFQASIPNLIHNFRNDIAYYPKDESKLINLKIIELGLNGTYIHSTNSYKFLEEYCIQKKSNSTDNNTVNSADSIFSLVSKEINPKIIFPNLKDESLTYDLEAYKGCSAQGILCTRSEPYISLKVLYPNVSVFMTQSLPLSLLLDPAGNVKTCISINLNNQPTRFMISSDETNHLQNQISRLITNFKDNPDYYNQDLTELLDYKIIKIGRDNKHIHGENGYKFLEEYCTQKKDNSKGNNTTNSADDNSSKTIGISDLETTGISKQQSFSAQNQKESTDKPLRSTSFTTIASVSIGIMGIIGLLLWLYKKR